MKNRRGHSLPTLALACITGMAGIMGTVGLWGCATSGPVNDLNDPASETRNGVESSPAEPGPDTDRKIGQLVNQGRYEEAMREADQWLALGSPRGVAIGAYWKAICLTHLNRSDSAIAHLKKYRGRWGGVMRDISAETLLRALETKAVQPTPGNATAPDKSSQARIESLERRTAEMQSEIERVQAENARYEKLLRELDRLP